MTRPLLLFLARVGAALLAVVGVTLFITTRDNDILSCGIALVATILFLLFLLLD